MKFIGLAAAGLTLFYSLSIAILSSALLHAIATLVGVAVLAIGVLGMSWMLFLTLFLAYQRHMGGDAVTPKRSSCAE